MKKIVLHAILVIVLLSVVLVVNALHKSYESEQIAQQQYEAEQSSILQSEAKQREKQQQEADQNEQLQREAEQNTRLQAEAVQQEKIDYEEMCQHIEDISEQLESVSKLLISIYEEFDYDRAAVSDYVSNNENDERVLEYRSSIASLRFMREIGCSQNNEYVYAFFEYPNRTVEYSYCYFCSEYHYSGKMYYIIYIPDEYMDEASIAIFNESLNGTLRNVKDNLFTIWISEHPPM